MSAHVPIEPGKETAKLLDSFDWSATPLGRRSDWPEALLISVGLCFTDEMPVLVAWGPEFIQIYNDAYAALIGKQHPSSFGQPGKKSWSSQWEEIAPMLDRVMNDGHSFHVENHRFTVSRKGYPEECYFTFSYQPLKTSRGVQGIFVTVIETTQQVVDQEQLRELRNEQLRTLFTQAPVAVALLKGKDLVVEIANARMLEIWDRTAEQTLNNPVFEVLPEAVSQGFPELLLKVYNTGEKIVFEEIPLSLQRQGKIEQLIIKFVYAPVTEADGTITGVMVLADDVTEQVLLRKRIEESEERMQMAIRSTRLGTWEYTAQAQKFISSPECRVIFGIPESAKDDYTVFNKCVYEGDTELLKAELAKAYSPAGTGSFELTHRIVRHSDRELRWIRSWGKIFFDSENKSEKFIGSVIDVTDQRRIEDTLRRNESRARLGIEAAGLGTFEYDVPRESFQHSERMAQIFGYNGSEKLDHQSFNKRIHPDDMKIRDAAIAHVQKTSLLFYEVRVVWPDNSIHWVRVNGVLLADDEEKLSILIGTAMDISKSKMQAEALEEIVSERTASLVDMINMLKRSEERYHRIVAEVQDYAIISLDNDGIIRNWNKGAEKIKRYSEAEILGTSFRVFYLPEDQQAKLPEKLLAEAARNGRAEHEGWRVRKDGSRFWGSIVITALHDANGAAIGFSKVTRDLTERKEAEDKQRGYIAQLEIRNKELEQFAFVASHDLQEPLRKIQTFSELIQSDLKDEVSVRRYFDKINVAAQRMRDLIRATLNYSSLSHEDLQAKEVDLNKVLSDVKTDMELLIQVKKVMIRSQGLPVVHGNSIQISQVFANLLGNAIKFSDKSPVIDISAKLIPTSSIKNPPHTLPEETYFELIFRDNGIGFEPQYEKRIFSIFQRLHGKDEYEGTGIGLALCQKIMENHQGYITATGEPGKGATFFLYFPNIVSTGQA